MLSALEAGKEYVKENDSGENYSREDHRREYHNRENQRRENCSNISDSDENHQGFLISIEVEKVSLIR